MSVDTAAAAATKNITPALQRWARGINTNDVDLITTAFTPDALFQGSRPSPLCGPSGVKDYYGSQPQPLTVDYELARVRVVSSTAVVAFLDATFHTARGKDRPTHITLVLEPVDGDWLINHYHVSFIG